MNGREGPSTAELAKRLQKRLNLAEFPEYDNRYNRGGVNKISAPNDGSLSVKGANRPDSHHGDEGENSNVVDGWARFLPCIL